jgi:hypothetical protein
MLRDVRSVGTTNDDIGAILPSLDSASLAVHLRSARVPRDGGITENRNGSWSVSDEGVRPVVPTFRKSRKVGQPFS